MFSKDELRAAYIAGMEHAKLITDNPSALNDDGFEEWFSREIENPPEGWDDHHN